MNLGLWDLCRTVWERQGVKETEWYLSRNTSKVTAMTLTGDKLTGQHIREPSAETTSSYIVSSERKACLGIMGS